MRPLSFRELESTCEVAVGDFCYLSKYSTVLCRYVAMAPRGPGFRWSVAMTGANMALAFDSPKEEVS